MISSSYTHYQTCFKVRHKITGRSPLITLQNIVYGWLLKKESDDVLRDLKKEFFRRCDWPSSLLGSRSSIATNTAYSTDRTSWALRYSHPDQGLGTRRYWHVDIGIVETKEEATFYARISFARSQYDLELDQPAPSITSPVFIRHILDTKSDLEVYSRKRPFGLFSKPVPLRAGYGQNLSEWIVSRWRKYAMIVFNGASPSLAAEASSLARDLAGKAQVLILDQDPMLASEIRSHLPADLNIPFGKFRVFYPLNPKNPRPERHRWFDIASPSYLSQRAGLLNSLLRHYTLEEANAVTNISEIGRMITLEKLRKQLASGESIAADASVYEDLISEACSERDAMKAERDQWIEECDAAEQERGKLKSQLVSLSHRNTSTPLNGFNPLEELHRLPQNLEEVVKVLAKMHAPKLVFSDEALASASGQKHCQVVDKAWEIINHIGTTLFEIKFGEVETGDIAKKFQERSGFIYAKTEGKTSKGDKDICKSRTISFEGCDFDIWPHIKHGKGVDASKLIRVHFAFDEDNRRIVIGYVGSHMPNATTRALK